MNNLRSLRTDDIIGARPKSYGSRNYQNIEANFITNTFESKYVSKTPDRKNINNHVKKLDSLDLLQNQINPNKFDSNNKEFMDNLNKFYGTEDQNRTSSIQGRNNVSSINKEKDYEFEKNMNKFFGIDDPKPINLNKQEFKQIRSTSYDKTKMAINKTELQPIQKTFHRKNVLYKEVYNVQKNKQDDNIENSNEFSENMNKFFGIDAPTNTNNKNYNILNHQKRSVSLDRPNYDINSPSPLKFHRKNIFQNDVYNAGAKIENYNLITCQTNGKTDLNDIYKTNSNDYGSKIKDKYPTEYKLPEINQKREPTTFSKRIFSDKHRQEFNPVTGQKFEDGPVKFNEKNEFQNDKKMEEILKKKINDNSNFLMSQLNGKNPAISNNNNSPGSRFRYKGMKNVSNIQF